VRWPPARSSARLPAATMAQPSGSSYSPRRRSRVSCKQAAWTSGRGPGPIRRGTRYPGRRGGRKGRRHPRRRHPRSAWAGRVGSTGSRSVTRRSMRSEGPSDSATWRTITAFGAAGRPPDVGGPAGAGIRAAKGASEVGTGPCEVASRKCGRPGVVPHRGERRRAENKSPGRLRRPVNGYAAPRTQI